MGHLAGRLDQLKGGRRRRIQMVQAHQHLMQGFDAEKAAQVLAVPEDYGVEIMIAVGKPGDPADLPANLQARDVPSPRKTLAEIAWEGPFRSMSIA